MFIIINKPFFLSKFQGSIEYLSKFTDYIMVESVSVADSKPKPERKIIAQSQIYTAIANLADPDAFDATELSLYDEAYSASKREPVSFGDILDGLTQLMTTGAVEVTEIVAAIHCEIMLRPLGRFDETRVNKWQFSLTGRIYDSIQHIMKVVGSNLGAVLQLYGNYKGQHTSKPLPESLKLLVNALNGVMGDHLVSMNNPLATPMMIYDADGLPQQKQLSGRIVLLIHGLCMSYLSWNPGLKEGLGNTISDNIPDTTVLYLDYNTGKRISINGRCLADMLQTLVEKNPDITQIDLVGHSMGGLVARSALFYAEQEKFNWVKRSRHLVTLGSPHHGAVLERIGKYALDILEKLPFAGSLATLGNIRSAGIIDLRHGSIRDEDWKNLDGRDALPEHFRHPAKIPTHINTYLVAGFVKHGLTTSKASKMLGDGLVSVKSALGEHAGQHTLSVPDGHKAVFYEVNHMELQHNPRIVKQLIQWLSGSGEGALNPRIYSYADNDNEDIESILDMEDSVVEDSI